RAYVGRNHRLSYLRTHEEVLQQFRPMIVFDSPMSGVFARAIGDFGYILRDPDEAKLVSAALAIHEKTVAPIVTSPPQPTETARAARGGPRSGWHSATHSATTSSTGSTPLSRTRPASRWSSAPSPVP